MYKKLKQPQQGDRTDLVDNINEVEALDLIDRVTANPVGTNQHSVGESEAVDNINTQVSRKAKPET